MKKKKDHDRRVVTFDLGPDLHDQVELHRASIQADMPGTKLTATLKMLIVAGLKVMNERMKPT